MIDILLYLVFIIAGDVIAAKWIIPDCWGVTLPWGIAAPAGVLFIGLVLTERDKVHDRFGWRATIGIVALASLIAWGIGALTGGGLLQRIAIASSVAFLFSELTDTAVYQHLIATPWLRRVLTSNAFSSVIDSVLFIGVAFGWTLWPLMVGQIITKNILGAAWAIVLGIWHGR